MVPAQEGAVLKWYRTKNAVWNYTCKEAMDVGKYALTIIERNKGLSICIPKCNDYLLSEFVIFGRGLSESITYSFLFKCYALFLAIGISYYDRMKGL